MSTPCGYVVDASDLTIVFKALYGTPLSYNTGFTTTFGGTTAATDLSQIFQPSQGPDSQIPYSTGYLTSGSGSIQDLSQCFMSYDYNITTSDYDANLSVFSGTLTSGVANIDSSYGLLVDTNASTSTGSDTSVSTFPSNQSLNLLSTGGGGSS
jgi:hypothetical protein